MDCPITLSEVPVKALTPHTSVKSKNFFSAKLPTIQNPLTNIQFPNPLKKPNKSDVSIKDIRTQANQLSNSYDGILQKFFATESQTLRKNLEMYDNTSQKCVEATNTLRTYGQSLSRISSQTSHAGILASRLCGYIVEQPTLVLKTTDEELIRLATANLDQWDMNMMPKIPSEDDDSEEEPNHELDALRAIAAEITREGADVPAEESMDANLPTDS